MRKLAAVFASLVVLLCLAFALWQSTRAFRAETDKRAVAEERDAIAARLNAVEAENKRLTAELAARHAAPPAESTPRTLEATAPDRTAGRGRRAGPFGAFESPEARRLMAIEQKFQLDRQYAGLFRALRLPADKLDRLKQLLLDRQNAPADVMSAAREAAVPGTEDARSTLQELISQEAAAVDASIHELLGPDAYAEYQDFEKTRGERAVVDQLAERLSYTDTPLSADQAARLVDLLAASRAAEDPTAAAPLPGGMRIAVAGGGSGDFSWRSFDGASGMQTALTDDSIAAAAGVLTPEQTAILRELQAAQQARAELGALLRRSFRSGSTTGAGRRGP